MSWTLFWILYAVSGVLSSTYWVHELISRSSDLKAKTLTAMKRNIWWSWPVGMILWPLVWVFQLSSPSRWRR